MDTQLANRTTALQIAFGAMATLAGLDKFFNLLADWPTYLSPLVVTTLPVSADVLMRTVGLIEIAVGSCILFAAPVVGTYIASLWLLAVAVNLVLAGHFDVAVRDVVLSIAALSLARSLALRTSKDAYDARIGRHGREVLSS